MCTVGGNWVVNGEFRHGKINSWHFGVFAHRQREWGDEHPRRPRGRSWDGRETVAIGKRRRRGRGRGGKEKGRKELFSIPPLPRMGDEGLMLETSAIDILRAFHYPDQLSVHLAKWTISNFLCRLLTRNIISHSMKDVAFHRLLRWKMIILPILTTSPTYTFLFKRLGEYTLWTWEWKSYTLPQSCTWRSPRSALSQRLERSAFAQSGCSLNDSW